MFTSAVKQVWISSFFFFFLPPLRYLSNKECSRKQKAAQRTQSAVNVMAKRRERAIRGIVSQTI